MEQESIAGLIKVGLGFLGLLMVVLMLMGGFSWITSSGNDEAKSGAVKSFVSGLIGLAIVLSAYAISNVVVEALLNANQ